MAKFIDLRKKSSRFTPSSVEIAESSVILSQLSDLNSKIEDLASSENLNDSAIQNLTAAIDYLNQVYDSIDPENSQAADREIANESFMSCIVQSLRENKNVSYILNDGESVEITPQIAECFAKIHDELNKHNQIKLQILATENINSYNFAMDFCKSN